GIDLRLRVGAEVWVNQIQFSSPPLAVSSDILLGMAIGIELALPAVAYLGDRPFGFRIKGGAIVPASRMQQPGALTTPHNSGVGGYVGASLHYGVLTNPKRGQLHIE